MTVLLLASNSQAQTASPSSSREIPSFQLAKTAGFEEALPLLQQLPSLEVPFTDAVFARVLRDEQTLTEQARSSQSAARLLLADGIELLLVDGQVEELNRLQGATQRLSSSLASTLQFLQNADKALARDDYDALGRANSSQEGVMEQAEKSRREMALYKAVAPGKPTVQLLSETRGLLIQSWQAAFAPSWGTSSSRLLLWKWLAVRFQTNPEIAVRRSPFHMFASARPELESDPVVRQIAQDLVERVRLQLAGNAIQPAQREQVQPSYTGRMSSAERATLTWLDGRLEAIALQNRAKEDQKRAFESQRRAYEAQYPAGQGRLGVYGEPMSTFPLRCPAGSVEDTDNPGHCLRSCADGRVEVVVGHCCWIGQSWDAETQTCSGSASSCNGGMRLAQTGECMPEESACQSSVECDRSSICRRGRCFQTSRWRLEVLADGSAATYGSWEVSPTGQSSGATLADGTYRLGSSLGLTARLYWGLGPRWRLGPYAGYVSAPDAGISIDRNSKPPVEPPAVRTRSLRFGVLGSVYVISPSSVLPLGVSLETGFIVGNLSSSTSPFGFEMFPSFFMDIPLRAVADRLCLTVALGFRAGVMFSDIDAGTQSLAYFAPTLRLGLGVGAPN
jgi:hypothetical protein